jgi:glutaredoxin
MIKSLFRSSARKNLDQSARDSLASRLVFYGYDTCPYCVKVRRVMKELGLDLANKNTARDLTLRDELQRRGGSSMVPCLQITMKNGHIFWLYESDLIVKFLKKNFA